MASFTYVYSIIFLSYIVSSVSSVLLESPNPTEKECHDNPNIECFDYEDKQCVGVYEGFGRKSCPFRCGYCPGKYPACADEIDYCDELGDNVCNNEYYGGFLRKNCRKFCNFCTYPGQALVSTAKPTTTTATAAATTTKTATTTTTTTTTKQNTATILPTGDACQDVIADCKQFDTESCAGVFRTWAIQNCPRTCGYCTNSLPCEDYEECEKLPSNICTENAYKVFAETSCRKFCKLCTAPSNSTSSITTSMPEASTKEPTSKEATTVKKTSADMTTSSTLVMKTDEKSSTEMMMTTVSDKTQNASMKPQTSAKMSTEMSTTTSMPMKMSTEMSTSTSMPMNMSTELAKSTSMPVKMTTTSQNRNSMGSTEMPVNSPSYMTSSKVEMSSVSPKIADPIVG